MHLVAVGFSEIIVFGKRAVLSRRKKNTSRFDADDSEENGNDDANFRLPGDDPRLERSAHRLFSALPHPMLESFVEEFLARVQVKQRALLCRDVTFRAILGR